MANDQIILDQILDQRRAEIAPLLDQPTYFEVFSAEQVLKDYDLSYDEIESGIVSGGGDGGIDGFYVFVNGELIHDDSDVSDLRKNIQIEVILIQAKTATGFSEVAMDRFASATSDLFDLSKPLESLKSVYRAELLQAAFRLRRVYQELASKFPRLRISYFYASKGDQVHPNVSRKISRIEGAVKQHFSDAESSFQFLKARDLLDLARKAPTTINHSRPRAGCEGRPVGPLRLFLGGGAENNASVKRHGFDLDVEALAVFRLVRPYSLDELESGYGNGGKLSSSRNSLCLIVAFWIVFSIISNSP